MHSVVASVAAGLLLWIQADGSPLLSRLKVLDDGAATRLVAAEPSGTRAVLDGLLRQFDLSVHSDRQRPEQRVVQYDQEALALGMRLGAIFARATGDQTYARRFEARKVRLEGTRLLNERQYAEAVTPLAAALQEAQALGDKWLQAVAHVNLAYAHLELGHADEALAESERADEVARGLDDRSRGLTLYNLASVHLHLRRFTESIAYAREALEVSRRAGIRLWEGNNLVNIGAAYEQLGDLEASRSAFEEALRVLETTRDRLGIGRVLYNLAFIAIRQDRYEQAAAYMERALPIIRAVDIRHSHEIELDPERYQNPIEVSALELLVDVYSHMGETARAAAHAAALRPLKERAHPGGHSHKKPPRE